MFTAGFSGLTWLEVVRQDSLIIWDSRGGKQEWITVEAATRFIYSYYYRIWPCAGNPTKNHGRGQSPKVQKLREAAPKFLSESKGIFTQLTSRPVHDDEDYLRKGKDLTMGILRCGRKAQAGNGRRFEDSFNYILRRPNSRRWMTAEWAEWLTVAWSKIPLARDSFLLLMTRTMNESMVGKSW